MEKPERSRSLRERDRGNFKLTQYPSAELLRLKAGDAISLQGTAKIDVYEKKGEHRASLDVTASHILALRQPAKAHKPRQEAGPTGNGEVARQQAPFDDAVPF